VVQLAGVALLWFISQPTPVTAKQLVEAYWDSREKADAKYKDRWLDVTGTVKYTQTTSTMAPGSTTVFVMLEGEKDIPGDVTIVVRQGFLFDTGPPGSTLDDFRKLAKGQEVTIRGKCVGKSQSDISFENPTLVAAHK